MGDPLQVLWPSKISGQFWTRHFFKEGSLPLLVDGPLFVMAFRVLFPALLGFLGGCGWSAAGITGCRPSGLAVGLPAVLRESSGVAWSRSRPGVLLSHNDSGHTPTLYALNPDGRLLGAITLGGARNRDWEDIATGECDAGMCIYVADTGDNDEVREQISLYRVTDTGIFDGPPRRADLFPMILPEGPRDIEAVFVLPGEEVFFVTKGRNHPVTVYRYPPPLRAGVKVTLEVVQRLSEGRAPLPRQVTGADATSSGKIVVIRTYEALEFYRVAEGNLLLEEGGRVALRTLNELQGEGVGLGPHGQVALTSEAVLGKNASMTILDCPMALSDM
jgi:hypothetical protein